MAKVIRKRFAKPTDPIYSGGPEIFSPRAFSPSSRSTPPATGGATREASPASTPKSPPESTPKRETE